MTTAKKPLARAAAELVVIVAVALGLALVIQAFVVKPYLIPSGSMLPTLQINQRILVDRIGSHFASPQIGDIYVFHPPAVETCANPDQGENQLGEPARAACDATRRRSSSQTYVKRVVGLPGDRLSILDGHVIRDGTPERSRYVMACAGAAECNFPQTITVPSGDYYMMGDNRPDSLDSRFWGPVPRSWLIGHAFFTYWPIGRIGTL